MKTPQPFLLSRIAALKSWRTVVLALALLGLAGAASAQTAKGRPLKLKINSPGKYVYAGEQVDIVVVCLDADNEAAPAPRPYTLRLMVHMPSGKIDTNLVTISAGESSGKATMVPAEAGLLHLQAQHDRLQQGDMFMRVKPASAKPKRESQPREARPMGESGGAGATAERDVESAAAESQSTVTERRLAARESAAAPDATKPTITFRYSPQRTLLADGKDGATIQAFLLDESDSLGQDIRVQLFTTSGALDPSPLVIPAGESWGTTTLTSQDVQTITVEYVQSRPATIVKGEDKLQIKFGPAISQIVLDPSPGQITLVDQCDLNIKLLDSEDQPLATDVERTVAFEIDNGRGEIGDKEIKIAPGSFQGRTTFKPTWRGQVMLAAATPNLPASSAPVKVSLPTLLLTLTAVGGVAGGFIAFWREANAKWWRILIGLLTGFVLYWGFIFGLLPMLPRNVALNPLSALALSVIGGWLGTEVFNIILRKLGIGGAPAGGQ